MVLLQETDMFPDMEDAKRTFDIGSDIFKATMRAMLGKGDGTGVGGRAATAIAKVIEENDAEGIGLVMFIFASYVVCDLLGHETEFTELNKRAVADILKHAGPDIVMEFMGGPELN